MTLQINPYRPELAQVVDIIEETATIRTLRVRLLDAEKMANFQYRPGQVGQLSIFGVGEATFVINSPPACTDYLQFSIMRTGELTQAIHKLSIGDTIGVRAPLGNGFPYEQWYGKNVFFIGGGIGMAPIRTIMLHLLGIPDKFGDIHLLYGGRSPAAMAYSSEMEAWAQNPQLKATFSIDVPCTEAWPYRVGLIPDVLLELKPSPQNTVAVLCGPPIMIKFTMASLKKCGFEDQQIFTTLEKRMKCGIGICGRCNVGDKFVCLDGPVFSMAELGELPDEM